MSGSSSLVVALAAAAGVLGAFAAREGVTATPALSRWVAQTVEPLRRAGREGYTPSALERRRLSTLGTVAVLCAAALLLGPGPAPFLALAGPALAATLLRRRTSRYRRSVDRALGEVARAVADALSAGRSLRAALVDTATTLEGPPASEMARVRADLELGLPTREALGALRRRLRSVRVEAFCSALLSQQIAGGDLATLLRRFAAAATERDRTAADARSATAQARFTGMLVAAMPVGAALFAELLEPGFVAGLLAEPLAAILLALSAVLQIGGFVAIGRLSRIGPHE